MLDRIVLRPVGVPGGLGPHKWRYRALLEEFESEDPSALPLLVDADGFTLEASRAGVINRAADGRLYTPPADGRILPSVTVAASRSASLALRLTDLRSANEIYVASALRGIQAASLARTGSAASPSIFAV